MGGQNISALLEMGRLQGESVPHMATIIFCSLVVVSKLSE
jgi:hypothetical protein